MPAKSIFGDVASFLNDNRDLAVPIVSRLAYGREGASAAALERERAYYGRLNGSGPVDPDGAERDAARREQTPGLSFLGGGSAGGTVAGIPPLFWVLGALVLGLIAFLLGRK